MTIEAMKLALNALKSIDDAMPFPVAKHAMSQLRQAIEQSTEQEPVGEVEQIEIDDDGQASAWFKLHDHVNLGDLLYTSPPQPQEAAPRKPLTDEEIWKDDGIMAANSGYGATFDTLREIVRATEAAHGIKENT